MDALLEANVTDIEIGPDGRLFIFGASRQLLELLEASGVASLETRRRLMAHAESAPSSLSLLNQAAHD
jgi:hypothetical protein